MSTEHKITQYATSSMKALKDEYNTVRYMDEHLFLDAVRRLEDGQTTIYVGMKDTKIIKPTLEKLLQKNDEQQQYALHTIDVMARDGRAVDDLRINPLTLRQMTGSSSGTAINVLIGMNDVGIGSDGGGSVLAPAMSVNLFSVMSPLFPTEKMVKKSTDNIAFSPSAGFITRSLDLLKQTTEWTLDESFEKNESQNYHVTLVHEQPETVKLLKASNVDFEQETVDTKASRETLIQWIEAKIQTTDIIISKEGPIDLVGYGDTLQGCFSELDTARQHQSQKGLIRVVNMAGLTAITVPASQLATGYVIITRSEVDKIALGFEIAKMLEQPYPVIVSKYFHT